MKRAAFSLLSLALGVGLTGAVRKSASSATTSPASTLPVHHTSVAAGTIARAIEAAVSPALSAPLPDESRAEALRRLRAGEKGTYIGDILAERDSSLARWASRDDEPLTVWIKPTSKVSDYTESYAARVRNAFEAWDALALPVHFTFVRDSAAAEVHVSWIDHFKEPISGRTRWTRGDDWVITDANIVLAVHHSNGEQLDNDAMYAMALHEIGHLLGLDHTQDSLAVMAPKVRVRDLSEADRATVRLLYALPAGPVR